MANTSFVRLGAVSKCTMPLSVMKNSEVVVVVRYLSTCPAQSAPPSTSASPLVLSRSHRLPSDAPQRSDEWFALRRDKLTTSTFSTALGMWKGRRRYELWHEKVFNSNPPPAAAAGGAGGAMEWGVLNEAAAIERYRSITGREVGSLGFAVHSSEGLDWVGASPDGLVGGGILEVKCPFNKGRPEAMLPWSAVPFYYAPQVQGLMEVMDRDWVDLYCWTPKGSTIFRLCRDRGYWELMRGVLHEFWWENVVPAREALSTGRREEADSFRPAATHKLTPLVVSRSLKLVGEAKLLCREVAGNVEFFH